MERKPIKRNPHIVKLSQDHHASLLFCFKLRQGLRHGVAASRMKPYVDYFSHHHFREHFAEEEQILFAPLKDKHDEMVQRALDEHVKVLSLVDAILSPTGGTDQQFAQLAQMVDDHVRFEERVLFPHLESVLSEDQLEEIGKQLPNKPLGDHYADEFWKKPKA